MARIELSRAELVKHLELQMDRVVMWIALGFFVLAVAIVAFA
jgi:hypothetical protein